MAIKPIPYTHDELFGKLPPRQFKNHFQREVALPMGGIGTGSISLGGWGQLRDFEIFNRPSKEMQFSMTFPTLYAKPKGKAPVTKIVQGPPQADVQGEGFGAIRDTAVGMPHMKSATFTGTFPIGSIAFQDEVMPLTVAVEGFNPFIPTNDKDSSIPCSILLYHVENPTEDVIDGTLVFNLENAIGKPKGGKTKNSFKDENASRGIFMETERYQPSESRFGTMALATPHKNITKQTRWHRGAWFDSMHYFWDHLSVTGELTNDTSVDVADENRSDIGSIGLKFTLNPGEQVTLPVIIGWHFPNFSKYWGDDSKNEDTRPSWKNYYASVWKDAWDVVSYVCSNLERLEQQTRSFQNFLYQSTLPGVVLDAVSSQISILKSTTCLRLPDGSFYAWEGCGKDAGCCEGTCTHVWNYAQALPYLFPRLERSIRDTDYANNLHDDGHMTFRMPLPLGTIPKPDFHAAADGQLGGILKTYREWLISGDDTWLKGIFPRVKRSLEYAWKYWDQDKDGVMEGSQHNTYDIEFYGPNTMMGSYYLAALLAGEKMARHLGDTSAADEYKRIAQSGFEKTGALLFNGEYYKQIIDPEAKDKTPIEKDKDYDRWLTEDDKKKAAEELKYQYGDGCLSDQMIGQWFAMMLNLGYVYKQSEVKKTLQSIFKYNWKSPLGEHANAQRVYALSDECGLLLCSWPHGKRPAIPFPYSDEVWPGIEYQVASHMIYEGLLDEGLAIVKGLRDRFDGYRRNPWNEFECGSHYARSMASYAVMLALAGFQYNAPEKSIGFSPQVFSTDFQCFWSVDSGFGKYRQIQEGKTWTVELHCAYGKLALDSINLDSSMNVKTVHSALCDGQTMAISLQNDSHPSLRFNQTATLNEGVSLILVLE